jgi:hypothetical protein
MRASVPSSDGGKEEMSVIDCACARPAMVFPRRSPRAPPAQPHPGAEEQGLSDMYWA